MLTRMFTELILVGVEAVKNTQAKDERPAYSLLRTILSSKIDSNGLRKETRFTKVF